MDLYQQTEKWMLEGRPFKDGFYLYIQLPASNPRLVRQMQDFIDARYVPDYYRLTVDQALIQYRKENKRKSMGVGRSAPHTDLSVGAPLLFSEKDSEEPALIQELRAKARKLHKRHAAAHGALQVASSNEARLEFSTQIMEEIIPSLDKIYDRIRSWENGGNIIAEASPLDVEDVTAKVVAKMNKVLSIKSRISRLKKGLIQNLMSGDRAAYEKELKEKEALLESLQTELGLI